MSDRSILKQIEELYLREIQFIQDWMAINLKYTDQFKAMAEKKDTCIKSVLNLRTFNPEPPESTWSKRNEPPK